MKSQFLGNLDARHLEGKWWKLLAPFGYYSAKFDITICAPINFILDFSSVPRWPIIYWLTGGTGKEESVPHDLGYRWFDDRWMFDYIFFEGGRARSKVKSNQSFLHRTGRLIRTTGMSGAVVLFGWIVKETIPGCLDYRNAEVCKRENCKSCKDFYPLWELCKMKGFHPEILKLHCAC